MKSEKKNLILLELIVVLFFFSLSAMVTIQLFVASYEKSVQNESKTSALTLSQDLIEQVLYSPQDAENLFLDADGWDQEGTPSGICCTRWFDKHMNPAPAGEKEAVYEMRVRLEDESSTKAGVLTRASVRVTLHRKNGEDAVILELDGGKYVPGETKIFA